MNLRRIKHTLLRLSAEEKVIGLGSLAIIAGTFMPWYSVIMNFDKKNVTETGFSGDMGVIGFIVFIMAIISLLILIGENMHLPLPRFGYKREQILFFFLGEAAFLALLTMAIYTKRSLDFTEAGLRFGLYTVLLGSLFGALSAFALMQKDKKKQVENFFAHHQEEELEEGAIELEEGDKEINEEDISSSVEHSMYSGHPDTIEDYHPQNHYDGFIENSENIEETPAQGEKGGNWVNQGNYFTREAGIGKSDKQSDEDHPSMEFEK